MAILAASSFPSPSLTSDIIVIRELPNPQILKAARGKWILSSSTGGKTFFVSDVIKEDTPFTHMSTARLLREFAKKERIPVQSLEVVILGGFETKGQTLAISFQNPGEHQKATFEQLLGPTFKIHNIPYVFAETAPKLVFPSRLPTPSLN